MCSSPYKNELKFLRGHDADEIPKGVIMTRDQRIEGDELQGKKKIPKWKLKQMKNPNKKDRS
ncbi:hypothetical protein KAU43_03645 [candidate division WOR-3 bacterium]|nr:hypothetical protein [candidate division WOR-3 bacterium]